MSHIPDLPTPIELGFPQKFAQWHVSQIAAIDRTIGSTKTFVAAVAPTGFGKTLYGMACTKMLPGCERAVYVTSTRGLQDQAGRDFASMGVLDIRGQQNYPCIALNPNGGRLAGYRRHRGYVGCDEGPCHVGVRCEHAPDPREPFLRPSCEYYGRVWDARSTDVLITNYAYLFSSAAYAQGLGPRDLIILDEAHDALKELENFLIFELSHDDIGRLGTHAVAGEDPEPWRDFGRKHFHDLRKRLEQWESHPPQDPEGAQEVRRLKAIATKLERLKDIRPDEWVIERAGGAIRFSPVNVSSYTRQYLFQGAKKVILMSATLVRKTLTDLGIPADDTDFMEFPSSFPVERRPVIAVQTQPPVRVNHRMSDTDKHFWMRRIDRLIYARQDLKGIIHTVSYARAKELMRESEFKDLMIFHDKESTLGAVQLLKELDRPCILVSPSIMTGYDFPYDECRYQIIGKVPLPDTRGKIMESRIALDPDYPYYLAMQKLVQATGRGMRMPDDWCETLIVDDVFGQWFLKRARKFAPQWFLQAVQYVDSLPAPLNFPRREKVAA